MKPPLTKEQRTDMLARYERGEKVIAIATLFAVTAGYVCHLARRCGIPRRRPHYRRAHV